MSDRQTIGTGSKRQDRFSIKLPDFFILRLYQ